MEILVCRERRRNFKRKVFSFILAGCVYFFIYTRKEELSFVKSVKVSIEFLAIILLWRENFKLLRSFKKKGGEILDKIIEEREKNFFL